MPSLDLTGRTVPWDVVSGQMPQFYSGIWDVYRGGAPTPLTPEEQVAPLDPAQQAAFQAATQYGTTGPGAGIADYATGQLGAGLPLDQVQAYQDVFGELAPGLNMEEVGGYVDNDILQGQIDAALRDPYRQFSEQTMPGIDFGASTTGGFGTRADLASDVATRGYLDRATDIAGQLRGDAYSRALSTALGTRGQDIGFMTDAARTALGTAGTARAQEFGLTPTAYDIGAENIALQEAGGAGRQEYEQMLRNAALRNWELGTDLPWNWAERYSGLAFPAAGAFGDVYGRGGPDLGEYITGRLAGGAADIFLNQISDWLGGG